MDTSKNDVIKDILIDQIKNCIVRTAHFIYDVKNDHLLTIPKSAAMLKVK